MSEDAALQIRAQRAFDEAMYIASSRLGAAEKRLELRAYGVITVRSGTRRA